MGKLNLEYDESDALADPTVENLQNQIQDLKHELFYLWCFVEDGGLGYKAEEYVKEKIDTIILFED